MNLATKNAYVEIKIYLTKILSESEDFRSIRSYISLLFVANRSLASIHNEDSLSPNRRKGFFYNPRNECYERAYVMIALNLYRPSSQDASSSSN